MTPHKHAALIKAWADGAEIEYRCADDPLDSTWYHVDTPLWNIYAEYRIKPETIKYRCYLWKTPYYNELKVGVTLGNGPNSPEIMEQTPTFVRWLTDWIEVEVVD